MNKEIFSGLDIEKKVEYVNEQLSLGKRVSKISKELGFSERAVGKGLSEHGYSLNDSQDKYIFTGEKPEKAKSTGKTKVKKDNDIKNYIGDKLEDTKEDKKLIKEDKREVVKQDKCYALADKLEDNEQDRSFILGGKLEDNRGDLSLFLQEKAETIEELVAWFETQKKNNLILKDSLVVDIDLPKDIVKKSIRVSEKVWNDFNEFCERHSDFTKQDIWNLALIDFLKRNE